MEETDYEDTVYRYALYVGSFSVEEDDHRCRTDKVQRELEALRIHKNERRVIICVSVKGIKIYSDDRSVIFMAHALRRISYATCDAAHRQFAFLAREPLDGANNQYCHVFVAESPIQAEELNRIVGDAFQLAYVQQLLVRHHQQQNSGPSIHPHSVFSKSDEPAVSGLVVPRLCDRHIQWPVSQLSSAGCQPSILGVIELPPPPCCPPPPPNQAPASSSACPRLQSPARQPLVGMDHVKLHQMDTPTSQICEPSFRRRAGLRRDNDIRLSGIADAQIIGGSTRQPRRRQGLSWTHLFASARHSAFIPGTQKNVPITTSDLLDSLGQEKSSKTAIFFDLRTFAGGSPVVALKERLDAQAVADAKASAFAEAAAVLAAAKQANEHFTSSGSSVNSTPRLESQPCTEASSVVNSSSPCSTSSTHSDPIHFCCATDFKETPPTPPLRLHSLRRSQNRTANSSPPQKPSRPETITERFYDEADSGISCRPFVCSGEDTKNRIAGRYQRPLSPRACSPVAKQPSHEPLQTQPVSVRPILCHQWSNKNDTQPVRVQDHRLHRSRKHQESLSAAQFPLHVAVTKAHIATSQTAFVGNSASELVVRSQAQVIISDSNPMTTSTLSTDTPTPTATPTPTPTQTPQPLSNCIPNGLGSANWGSSEDAEFLKQAPWYQAHLPREIAFELLAREELGSFIVRNSVSHPDCCALSVRVPVTENPTGITHYLIQRTSHGVRLKGLDKWWPSLKALITHLTVIPEMLPCPLRLPKCVSNPVFIQADKRPSCIGEKSSLENPLVGQSKGHVTGKATCMAKTGVQQPIISAPAEQAAPIPASQVTPNRCPLTPEPTTTSSMHLFPVARQSTALNGHCNNTANKRSNICLVPSAITTFGDSNQSVTRTCRETIEQITVPVANTTNDEEYQLLSDFSSIIADFDQPTFNKGLTSSC